MENDLAVAELKATIEKQIKLQEEKILYSAT